MFLLLVGYGLLGQWPIGFKKNSSKIAHAFFTHISFFACTKTAPLLLCNCNALHFQFVTEDTELKMR